MTRMIITARVKTRQKTFSIERQGEEWLIAVRSPPEKNEANRELLRELAKRYGSARILSGHGSRIKRIELAEKDARK